METQDKEVIRQTVRDRYGKIAKTVNVSSEATQAASCCDPTDTRMELLPMATCCSPSDTATKEDQTASCCGPEDFSIKKMSAYIGYSKEELESVPEGADMGLGCGNPVALASLKPGETVVDLGSGGGFDCFLAAKEVGETGHVIGVDMTPEMISKARKNAEKIKTSNVEFRLGEIEHLPIADNMADIIISNCVINLSPDKLSVYHDAFRALKPGGRLMISDILTTAPLPDDIRNDLALVSACIGGASTIENTKELLEEAGFESIEITPKDDSRKLIKEWNSGKSATAFDYLVSAYIEAIKPS